MSEESGRGWGSVSVPSLSHVSNIQRGNALATIKAHAAPHKDVRTKADTSLEELKHSLMARGWCDADGGMCDVLRPAESQLEWVGLNG